MMVVLKHKGIWVVPKCELVVLEQHKWKPEVGQRTDTSW